MRTFTLPSHPNTHAHNPFLFQTCACCKLQMWVMSGEMVKAAIRNLSVLCDPATLIQPFRCSLKRRLWQNWHPKHWTRPKTDRCISSMSHYLRTGLLVFWTRCYVERTRTVNPWRRRRRGVFHCNMWNWSLHNEVWHPGGLKSLITMLWRLQKSKIHYLLYTI
jgi:hypothetical protein